MSIQTTDQLVENLRIGLLAGSLALPRALASTQSTVEDLRVRFLERLADPTASWQNLAELFITHEASIGKLRNAVGVTLRSAAEDDGMRAEVFAEAGLTVLMSFKRRRDLGYVDGFGSFDSWLYSVWKRAVLYALRRLSRGRKRGPRLVFMEGERLERELSSNGRSVEVAAMSTLREVLDVIGGLPAGETRNVMLDWASGLSGADSARQRGFTEAWICILRKRGVGLIRERLGLTPPTNQE